MTGFDIDMRCANVELDRLSDGFTTYDHFNFAAVLFRNYLHTYEDVHILTDSLRQSGQAEVDRSTASQWEGHISYGGASSGPQNPVKYAAVEYFRGAGNGRRGSSHDFMAATNDIDDELIGPLSGFISRGANTPHPEMG